MDICKYTPLSMSKILCVLKSQKICNLGTMSLNNLEIIPMWYVFDYKNSKLTFYFISANNGEKMDNMKDTGIVCVSINKCYKKCCTEVYNSIVANGNATIIKNSYEKTYILNKFKEKYGTNNCYFDECHINKLDYIKVDVYEVTGRAY